MYVPKWYAAKSITHPAAFVFTSGDIYVSGITSHTVTYAYDANNRLLTETEEVEGDREFAGTKSYTYDDAGNLIGKTTGGDYGAKTESYVYDAFGRMTEYKVGGETVATYGYNGNGERVSKTVGESLTKFYLENGNVINEGNGTAINVTNYFGAAGIFKRVTGDAESILYKNGHGDVVRKTSGTSVIRDYDYDAYGKEKTAMADDNPFRYAGEYQDLCSGLIYLRNRYYDPSIGRFISEDPIRSGTNWYVYANNNPVNAIDPSGLRTYFINGINNSKEEGSPQYSIDFANKLTEKGVEDVRTIGVYNGTGTITGVGQVAMEMVNKGKYAENVANRILEDIENDPLADGEELNLIGYSGGGQIVLNVCELLQGKATVDNSVLIGTPVSELTLNNTGETTMIYAGFDPLSWNVSWYPISLEFAGWIGHTSYFNKDNIGKVADLVNKHID